MDKNDLSSYKNLHVQTALDYVKSIKEALEVLTKDPEDAEAVKTIHLDSHSLKSQSFAIGYKTNAQLFKTLEDIFARNMEYPQPISYELVEDLKTCVVAFEESLQSIQESGNEKDLTRVDEKMQKYIQ